MKQSFILIKEIIAFIWDQMRQYVRFLIFELLKEVTLFFNENIPNKFTDNFPRLIHSTKWKFDYIVATKNNG